MPVRLTSAGGREGVESAGGKMREFNESNRLSALCVLTIVALLIGSHQLLAEPAFVPTTTREAVGVERGSTALIGPVDKTTFFATFDTFGSEEIGPSIMSTATALPGLIVNGDQFDAVAVLGGPVETGRQELLAGGLGYRIKLPGAGPTLFVSGDYADITLGSAESRALDAKGQNWNLTFGARRDWALSPAASVTGELSFTAREWYGEVLGTPTIDEDLRVLRARFSYRSGTPIGVRKRFGVILHKAISGLGSSGADNPMPSLPGASAEFFTASFSADASMPLSEQVVLTAGTVGQWSDAPLPFSQRCGYGTNEFSRAFDRSFVNGDRCFGSRAEIGYNLPAAAMSGGLFAFAQLFAAADAGWLWDVGNEGEPSSHDGWGSVYAGLRAATSNFIAEISISKILDEPVGLVDQDSTRVWIRSAARF